MDKQPRWWLLEYFRNYNFYNNCRIYILTGWCIIHTSFHKVFIPDSNYFVKRIFSLARLAYKKYKFCLMLSETVRYNWESLVTLNHYQSVFSVFMYIERVFLVWVPCNDIHDVFLCMNAHFLNFTNQTPKHLK